MPAEGKRNGRRQRKRPWTEDQSVFLFRFACVLVGILLRWWVRRFRAFGVTNVPSRGGVYLIANHTSGLDPFLLAYPVSRRAIRGPGKIELFRNPVIGWLMKKVGIFPLRQDVADAAAVRTMVSLYRAGEIVIVYPEGGRSATGELRQFKSEFARLVIRMRAVVVPAGIAGARDVLPIGSLIPRPDTAVAVVYGEPFELSSYYDVPLTDEVAAQAAAELQARVAAQLAEAKRKRDCLAGR